MRKNATLDMGLNAPRAEHERPSGRLGRIIFYALLTLIALAAIPYGLVEAWWQSLFNCAAFMLAALWLVDGFLEGSWEAGAYRLLWPLLALALYGLVQTLPLLSGSQAISADPHGTRQWFFKMLALILVGAMLLRYTRDRVRLRALVSLAVGVALASAAFGLVRQMMQHQPGFVLPYLVPGEGYGQFINKNHFPFLMESALGLLLGLILWGGGKGERRFVFAGLALTLAGALVLANSRGGVLALVCQLLFAASLLSFTRPTRDAAERRVQLPDRVKRLMVSLVGRLLLLLCFSVFITVGVVWVGGDPLVRNLEAIPREVGAPRAGLYSAQRRWDIWPASWRIFKEHPLTGAGFGGYWMAISLYHEGSGEKTPQEAHNDYLEFLASGGLIACALGLWFIFELIRGVRQRLRTADEFERAATYGALIGLSGIAIHSFVDFGLHIFINALILLVLIVIATARTAPVKRTNLG